MTKPGCGVRFVLNIDPRWRGVTTSGGGVVTVFLSHMAGLCCARRAQKGHPMSTLCLEELHCSYSRILAKAAPVIIAMDEACAGEPVLLFDSGCVGEPLTIMLLDGDAIFETDNLRTVTDFVKRIKGSCCFQMSHDGVAYPDESSWPQGLSSDTSEPFTVDDPDDGSDFWKRGDV